MRRRDPDATREALKQVARELFATRGFEETRTRDIADRAGVNKAMINYHFGGKQGLFSAVVVEGLERGRARLADAADPDRPAPQQLADFIEAFARFGKQQPEFVLTMVREQMNGGRHLEPPVLEQFFGFFLHSRRILEQGIADGSFRPIDPHATHLSLVGALVYYLLTEPARHTYAERSAMPSPVPSPDDYLKHVIELFLRGLGRQPTTGEEAQQPSPNPGSTQ